MPRVPDEYLRCIVYLYTSIPAAEAGEMIGGTGFIVRLDENGVSFHYVVTNKHVVRKGGSTVRFNTLEGVHEAVEYDKQNWFTAQKADLAVYLMPADLGRFNFRPISIDEFITQEIITRYDLGIGDDVFFSGRFINAEGKDRNRPSLRFGTIAQADTDLIDGEESYLVEARSISGYSGSPVFFYIEGNASRGINKHLTFTEPAGPWLLGVDWSHINDYVDAKDRTGVTLPFQVRSNSGMMGVVPVWQLEALLSRKDVKEQRAKDPRNDRAATPDVAGAAASRDASLNTAARKRPPGT
jgi:hypothetical protein